MPARVEYTFHARQRMRQREITEEEVEFCLGHYDVTYPDPEGNPIFRATLPTGKRIKVVVKADSKDPIVVITTAPLP